ncbi:MAG: DUF1501 domain-containing protein [Actinomycetota bacterium]
MNFRGSDCENFHRRDILKIGALGVAGGLSMTDLFALRAQAAAQKGEGASASTPAESVILIWQGGGPSHIDTWDPKPEAPAEIRGTFDPIDTAASGIQISEHLPLTAKQMDKIALIRSITTNEGAHERGTHYMLTGFTPLPGFQVPGYGSVISKYRGSRSALPPYIAIPGPLSYGGEAGFLGAALNPFSPSGDPSSANFSVRDLDLPGGVTPEQAGRRRTLREAIDGSFAKFEKGSDAIRATGEFYNRAYTLLSSQDARAAFDMKKEPDATRNAYGRNRFGQSCLLARRLVEAGVRFVTVSVGGWDTHYNGFRALGENVLPNYDRTFSTLISDLSDRGLLKSTMVISMGEFGRTPVINRDGGRDHYARVFSMAMAGGGIKGGQVIGASDARGMEAAVRPVRPEDVAATIYRQLGIDYTQSIESAEGVRITLSRGGRHIQEMLEA